MPWSNGKNTWLEGLSAEDRAKIADGLNPETGGPINVAGASGSLRSDIRSGELNDTKDGITDGEGIFSAQWYASDSFLDKVKSFLFTVADIFATIFGFRKLVEHSPISPIESSGKSFDANRDAPYQEFDLSVNDPRYQHCLEFAHSIRDNNKYSLKGLNPADPKDYQEIVKRERLIADAVIGKIHQEYGDYNEVIASELAQGQSSGVGNDPSMHDDTHRGHRAAMEKTDNETVDDVPRLSEFQNGTLICRQYAPLASALLTEAGSPNLMVTGKVNQFSSDGGLVTDSADNSEYVGHVFVVSRLTGNIFESTSPHVSYSVQTSNTSLKDFLAGKSIVTGGASQMQVYGTGYSGDCDNVENYDRVLAQQTYDTRIRDGNERMSQVLNTAVEGKNASDVEKICESFPFEPSELAKALNQALSNHDIKTSQALIDQGALQGFTDNKIDLFFSTNDALFGGVVFNNKLDPSFAHDLAKRLGLTPQQIIDAAKDRNIRPDDYENAFKGEPALADTLDHNALASARQHGAVMSNNGAKFNASIASHYVPVVDISQVKFASPAPQARK